MSVNLKEDFSIGIIGALGDMGKLYAQYFIPHFTLHLCDLPQNYSKLQQYYSEKFETLSAKLFLWPDGYEVSRRADFIIYSVEAENIGKVVEMFGKATKCNAIVSGQTSVKKPEIEAFLKYLPQDVEIISIHSLHGPTVSPKHQPLVVIPERVYRKDSVEKVKAILLKSLQSDIVELSWQKHDQITADTQAVTHLAFLSMGTAWKTAGVFPWLNQTYIGGIENAKVMTTLRIYSSKWHVYAGLAILNPSAQLQIEQYAKSVTQLFKLMITNQHQAFRSRILEAAEFVFSSTDTQPILLSDDLLNQFSLSKTVIEKQKPNSHLSILAIVDCWKQLGLNPYEHLICQTPPFRLWLGITEYLFKSKSLLDSAIQTALEDFSIRGDDFEFVNATRGWAQTILLGSMNGYQKRFEETAAFFNDQLIEAKQLSTEMFRVVTDNWQQRKQKMGIK